MARNLSIFHTIEQDLLQQKARLLGKVPEIKKSLTIVELLQKKQSAGQEVGVPLQRLSKVFGCFWRKGRETRLPAGNLRLQPCRASVR